MNILITTKWYERNKILKLQTIHAFKALVICSFYCNILSELFMIFPLIEALNQVFATPQSKSKSKSIEDGVEVEDWGRLYYQKKPTPPPPHRGL